MNINTSEIQLYGKLCAAVCRGQVQLTIYGSLHSTYSRPCVEFRLYFIFFGRFGCWLSFWSVVLYNYCVCLIIVFIFNCENRIKKNSFLKKKRKKEMWPHRQLTTKLDTRCVHLSLHLPSEGSLDGMVDYLSYVRLWPYMYDYTHLSLLSLFFF